MSEDFKVVPSKPLFSINKEGVLKNTRTGNIIKLRKDKDGYLRGSIFFKNKTHHLSVHRAVAEVFCEGYDKGLCVNHKDGVRDNNTPSNLEWVTHKMNVCHAVARGTHGSSGEKHSQAKVTEADVIEICTLLSKGLRIVDVANIKGISQGIVHYIKKGITWREVTEKLDFFKVPPKKETFSLATVYWVKEQLKLNLTDDEILEQANSLDKEKLSKIKNYINECNDYPERE